MEPRDSQAAAQARRADSLADLLAEIRACRICAADLPLGPRPVLRADRRARILIAGQAPGTKVHASGIPWDDPSGDRLRAWLALDPDVFYDETRVAIVPMGFCYPGRGKGGDLPPRPECAATWHGRLWPQLPNLSLIVAVGAYAQAHHLGAACGKTLTDTVAAWRDHAARGLAGGGPVVVSLPHPSPRNRRWLRDRPWVEGNIVPFVRRAVHLLLDNPTSARFHEALTAGLSAAGDEETERG